MASAGEDGKQKQTVSSHVRAGTSQLRQAGLKTIQLPPAQRVPPVMFANTLRRRWLEYLGIQTPKIKRQDLSSQPEKEKKEKSSRKGDWPTMRCKTC